MKTENIIHLKRILVCLAIITFSSTGFARPGGEGRGQRGAPQEAIQACEGLAVDETCQFEGRRGSISGTCFVPSEDQEALACKPSDHDSRSQNNGEER